MKNKTLVVTLLGALVLGACVQMPELPAQEEEQETQAAAVQVGSTTLDLYLPVSGDDSLWVSEQYLDKPVLMAFMATWCPWCKRSLAALDQTTAAYKDKVEVVGVFIEKDINPVEQVKKDFNIQSKILYDGGDAAKNLGVNGFPHIMLFDKKHRLVRVWSGYSDTLADEYARELDKLLK